MLGWHPRERRILIQTSAGSVEQVHTVDAPGASPVPITASKDTVTGGASYSPAGGAILFRVPGAQENAQIFRLDPATKEIVLLTDGKSKHGAPVWSRSGAMIAFESNRRNGKDLDLYVMDPAKPDSARLLSEVSGTWSVSSWSADDRELLAIESRSSTESYMWRVNAGTGAKTALTPPAELASWRLAQFSADGKSVFAVSNRGSEFPRVWRGNLGDGSWSAVTRDGDAVESAVVSPDGKLLAVVFDRDASSRLEILDAASLKTLHTPRIPTGLILGVPVWNRASTDVAVTLRSVSTFGDVFSVSAGSGAVVQWTVSESGAISRVKLPDAEIVRWKSFDGQLISGVLYRPPSRFTGKRPVIINIHGGPANRERPRFQGRSAYFMNELGIAIVYPNVRGSTGFGKTFETADNGLKREDAVKDIGALLDWIAAQPDLDKDRVMVTGASYGGYMTYAVAEMYPNRIRCAYAGSGISNFITYFEDTNATRLADRRVEYGDERDPRMRDFLTRISPVTQASKLRTPLLIAHGRQDSRVPVGQAEELYRAAKANGAPVWLVVYDDEGHERFPEKPANTNFHFYTWILFVQKYLIN
jgi:dipeptidyl aminopeptidase/acylaminoacyl peptidase